MYLFARKPDEFTIERVLGCKVFNMPTGVDLGELRSPWLDRRNGLGRTAFATPVAPPRSGRERSRPTRYLKRGHGEQSVHLSYVGLFRFVGMAWVLWLWQALFGYIDLGGKIMPCSNFSGVRSF